MCLNNLIKFTCDYHKIPFSIFNIYIILNLYSQELVDILSESTQKEDEDGLENSDDEDDEVQLW